MGTESVAQSVKIEVFQETMKTLLHLADIAVVPDPVYPPDLLARLLCI